ncbi:hypothetical protein NBT05_05335 [Aquimarina sp. ERC-38]|uniref:hypothetical protein n=1 Tax=Aquimarina sp. ERC-38 TaxID=2949996 RepID=UPI002248178F|nr:hypothetical protein [Aquimarina sp. ERC-38]UZO81888.1 hypothetical protein NBT05_05335 [Aquimarina sp. ERC-38]
MKIVFLSLALIIISNKTLSQNCPYNEYKGVLEVSEKVNSKKLKSINDSLKRVFEIVQFPLSSHLQYAIDISKKTKDIEFIHSISIILAKGGIPKKYFRRYSSYNWYNEFNKEFYIYDSIYRSSFNIEFKKKIIEIIEDDRNFNKSFHKWRAGKEELTLSEMIKRASYIAESLENVLNNYGLPIEKNIGYFLDQHNNINNLPFAPLIIHVKQRGRNIVEQEQIKKLVCYGVLGKEYIEIIPKIRGLSKNFSVKEEMTLRFNKYKMKN